MPEKLFLQDLLQSVLQPRTPAAASAGVHLIQCHDPALPLLIGNNQNQLREILSLIVDTAIRDTQASEVSCSVTQLLQWDTASILRFRFDDNGPALRNELSAGYKRNMSRAQYLIQQLNGSSEVVTAPGYTNSFQFLMQCQTQKPCHEDLLISHRPEILILDNHEVNQQNLQDLLHQWRMPHVLTTQAKEAIKKLEKGYEPDIILVNADLPTVDGIQFTRVVRNMMNSPIPVVGMFAQHDPEQLEKGMAAGMNDYLLKPFRPSELLAQLTYLTRKAA